jgi:hypothetical protein
MDLRRSLQLKVTLALGGAGRLKISRAIQARNTSPTV